MAEALAKAKQMCPTARRRVLTLTADPLPFEPSPAVEVGPTWQWMLDQPGSVP